MTLKKILLTTAVAAVPVLLAAQGQPQGQAAPAAARTGIRPASAWCVGSSQAQAQGQGGLDPGVDAEAARRSVADATRATTPAGATAR